MITLIMSIVVMFALVVVMYITDNNRKKYTDYQMKNILKQTSLYTMAK